MELCSSLIKALLFLTITVYFPAETLKGQIFQLYYSSPLFCHAADFFPQDIRMFWQKDGVEVKENVELKETIRSNKKTFYKRIILRVSPENLQEHKYTCVIQHSSMKRDLVLPASQRQFIDAPVAGQIYAMDVFPPVLICFATDFYPREIKIVWKKNGEEVKENILNEEVTAQKDGTFSTRSFLSVSLIDLLLGSHTCVIQHNSLPEDFVLKSSEREILTVPPKAEIFQRNTFPPKLVCYATGFFPGAITMSWLKDGEEVEENVDVSKMLPIHRFIFWKQISLSVSPANLQNHNYTCVIQHKALKDDLVLLASERRILRATHTAVMYEVDTIPPTLQCHTTGFYPKEIIMFWEKDEEEVNENVDDKNATANQDGSFGKTIILTVSPEDLQNHNYTCVIQHSSLEERFSLPASERHIYTVPPEALMFQLKSSSPELVCYATGFLPRVITMSWLKDGEEVEENQALSKMLPNYDGTIWKRSVLNVTSEDLQSHNYTCVIQHSGLKKDLVLRASERQILTGSPRFYVSQMYDTAPPTCQASNFFPKEITMFWQKDGEKIKADVFRVSKTAPFWVMSPLTASPEELWKHNYTCVIQHSSLKQDVMLQVKKPITKPIPTERNSFGGVDPKVYDIIRKINNKWNRGSGTGWSEGSNAESDSGSNAESDSGSIAGSGGGSKAGSGGGSKAGSGGSVNVALIIIPALVTFWLLVACCTYCCRDTSEHKPVPHEPTTFRNGENNPMAIKAMKLTVVYPK